MSRGSEAILRTLLVVVTLAAVFAISTVLNRGGEKPQPPDAGAGVAVLDDRRTAATGEPTEASKPRGAQSARSVAADFVRLPTNFKETFDASPDAPTQFIDPDWTVNVSSRDSDTWYELEPMEADHGPGCEPPIGATRHTVTRYEDVVFRCKDHVMTAVNASGYAVAYLTPNAMVDFSNGPAVIRFDVSTFRSSQRDWIDLWVSSWDDQLSLPFNPDTGDVDLQGAPVNALQLELELACSGFKLNAYVDGLHTAWTEGGCWDRTDWHQVLEPDKARRETIELLISRTHVKLWMPDYALVLVERDVELGFTRGVVQFGHHSYNPRKDCGVANSPVDGTDCEPTTWHWDNVTIDPAVSFAANHADRRIVEGPEELIRFDEPARAGSYLRFSGVGTIEVSFNNGTSWNPAARQETVLEGDYHPEHASNYWTPVPAGTETLRVRFGEDDWYSGPFHARDFVIWSP